MSQLTLAGTGTPTPPDVVLTRRQRFALEIIAEKEPISSERLGAYLHELRAIEERGNGHGSEDVCRFCKQEGYGIGERLRELDLVRFSTKAHGWRLATSDVRRLLRPGGAYDPSAAEIPF